MTPGVFHRWFASMVAAIVMRVLYGVMRRSDAAIATMAGAGTRLLTWVRADALVVDDVRTVRDVFANDPDTAAIIRRMVRDARPAQFRSLLRGMFLYGDEAA